MSVQKIGRETYVSKRLGNKDRPTLDEISAEKQKRQIEGQLKQQNSWTELHGQYGEANDLINNSCADLAAKFIGYLQDQSLVGFFRDASLMNEISLRLSDIRNGFVTECNTILSTHRHRFGPATDIDDNSNAHVVFGKYADMLTRFGGEVTECANQFATEVKLAEEALAKSKAHAVTEGVQHE